MSDIATTEYDKEPYGVNHETSRNIITSIESGDLEESKHILSELHPADCAHFISTCNDENRARVLSLLNDSDIPNILISFDRNVIDSIVNILGFDRTANILLQIDTDDIVFIARNLSDETIASLNAYIPASLKHIIKEALSYPEGSTGCVMRRRVVTVMQYWTVAQIIDYIRYNREAPEEFSEIFVLNSKFQPLGSIQVSKLLGSLSSAVAKDLLEEDYKTVTVDTPQSEVAYLFTQYDLRSVAVVGKNDRFLGAVTSEDVIEVLEKKAETDVLRISGMSETDFYSNTLITTLHRSPWLIINLFISLLTCSVINVFHDTLSKMIVLASIMPIVAAVSGNAGTQALTITVRALAYRDISPMNALRLILKELAVGAINGSVCAVIGSIIIYVWKHDIKLSIIFAMSLIISLSIAGLAGITVPLLLKKLRTDPAISSGVFLIVITDITGFFSFLGLAALFL